MNPFVSLFAAARQGDIQNLDGMVQSLVFPQQPAAPPMQGPPVGPQTGMTAPAGVGAGYFNPAAVTGNGPQLPPPPNVWEQPAPNQVGVNPNTDRPTGVPAQIYTGMLQRGIPEHIAAGFMENFQDESGFQIGIQERSPRSGRGGRGIYQLTGPRRKAFEAKYGEDGYTIDNQLDFLMEELGGSESAAWSKIQQARTPGEAAALITTEFLRPAEEHQRSRVNKYLGGEGGSWMSAMNANLSEGVDDVDYSEMDEEQQKAMEDMSPEAQRRRKWSMVLMGLGTGLTQISKGKAADISDIVNQYHDRQAEMRSRIIQMQQERVRRAERAQSQELDIANREDQQEFQAGLAERQHEFQTSEREAGHTFQTAEREASQDFQTDKETLARERAASAGSLIFGDSPDAELINEVIGIDPTAGFKFGYDRQTRATEAAEEAKTAQQRETVAAMYEAAGVPEAATMVLNGDPVGARDLFVDRTGDDTTPQTINYEYMKTLKTPEERAAFAQAMRLETGTIAPHEEAAMKLKTDDLNARMTSQRDNVAMSNLIKQALSMASDPEFESGMIDSYMLGPKQFLASIGLGDTDKVSQQEVFRAISKRLISYMRQEGEGPMSDADALRFEQALGSLEKTPGANVAILQMYSYLNDVENARTDAMYEYFAQGGDITDVAAERSYVDDYLKENNLWGGPFKTLTDDMNQEQREQVEASIPDGTAYYDVGVDGKTYLYIKGQEPQ